MANEEKKTEQSDQGKEKKKSNTCLIIALVVIGILVLLTIAGFLGAKYLWSNFSEKANEEYVERAVEETTGDEVDFDIDGEGEWPTDLDQDLEYPDSQVQSSSSHEAEGEEGITVSLTSDDQVDSIYDYYVDLEEAGWEVSYKLKNEKSDTGESASISLIKDDWNVAVTVNSQEDEGNSLISILAGKDVE